MRSANPRHVIVPTAWVYSPRTELRQNDRESRAVEDTLTVVEDQRGTPTSALDLADSLEL